MGFDVLQEWSRFLLVMVMVCSKLHCVALDMQCPLSSQWKFRSDSYCSTNKSYLCLYDENTRQFKEFCQDEPSFDAAGYKIILVGGLHGIPCEEMRYQPFKYWTNGSSKCVFEKSKCNVEGTLFVQDGTAKSDRTCRCDYTRGYDFVIKPKNKCFCIPTEEDCSCYLTPCKSGFLLTPDYACVSTTMWKTDFVCPFIKNDRLDEMHNLILHSKVKEELFHSTEASRLILTVLLIVSAILILVFTVLLCCLQNGSKEEQDYKTKISSVSKENATLKANITALFMDVKHITEYRKKEKEKWTTFLQKFVETTASRSVEHFLTKSPCVVITGPFGCGKSSIAFRTAFQFEQTYGYDILIVLRPADVIKYASAKCKQLFIIDDVFGKYSRNEIDIAWWSIHSKSVGDILSMTDNIKLLMTCRSNIYKSATSGLASFPYVEVSLISDSHKLSLNERKEICQSYLTQSVYSQLTDTDISLYYFFPTLCVNFPDNGSQINVKSFFQIPYDIVSFEIKQIEKSDLAFLVLALLCIKNDNVDKTFFAEESRDDEKLFMELSDELGYAVPPRKRLLLEMFNALDDTFLKSTEFAFKSIVHTMFDIIAYKVGGSILRSLIKYGSKSFLKDRVFLKSYRLEKSSLFIEIPLELEKQYFTRLGSDINKGALWEVLDSKQSTVLDCRVKFKEVAMKYITKLSAEDSEGSTALHVASARGYSEYIELFIALDISKINQKNNKGRTPLHLACEAGHIRAASILIEHGAFLDNIDSNEMTPLDIACSKGYVEMVDVLLSKSASVNSQRTSDKRTALHVACNNGNVKITTLLLRGNALVNLVDKKGYTPLHLAAIKGNVEIVKLLVQFKANIDSTDNSGKTPLVHAREKNRTEVVDVLIKHKASNNSNE